MTKQANHEKEEIMKKFKKVVGPSVSIAAKNIVKEMLDDKTRSEDEKEKIREVYQDLVENTKKLIFSKIEESYSSLDEINKDSALSIWAAAAGRAKRISESISELEKTSTEITSNRAYEIICDYISPFLAISRALSVAIDERYYSDVALFKRFIDQARPAIKYLNEEHVKALNDEIFSFIGDKYIFYEDEAEKEKVKSFLHFDQEETQALKKELNKLIKGYKDTSITKTTKRSLRRYYEKIVKVCAVLRPKETKLSNLPQKLMVTNTKAGKKIIDGSAYEKRKRYITAWDRFGDPIEESKVALYLWMDGNEVNKFTDIKLSRYDLTVFFVVATIFYNGQSEMTLNTIYKVMCGNGKAKATSTIKAKIMQSLDKLSNTKFEIEEEGINFRFKGNFLTIENIIGNYQGQKNTSLIHVLKTDSYLGKGNKIPFIEYAKAKNQLLLIPKELMNVRYIEDGAITEKMIRHSDNYEALIFYLRERIFQIRREARKPANKRKYGWNVILFSSVLKALNLGKRNSDRIRKSIEQTFDYWKELPTEDKGGHFILGYKKVCSGNEYKYIIEL